MTGRAWSSRFPYIPLRIEFANSVYSLDLETFIDTGFDGDLILPLRLFTELPSPRGQATWRMADGSSVDSPYYPTRVQMLGLADTFEANASLLGDEALIGRLITNRFRITLDHGRVVVVEP